MGNDMRKRDQTIDIIRGIAIVTMVASNLTPYALAGDPPEWFRFYGTFAAPLFISLAGMMVRLTGQYKQYSIWHYVKRGLTVIAAGALIDAYIWGLVPFLTMDVLYLIGLALPVCYLLGKFHFGWRCAITLAIFAATPHLQEWTGYRYAPDGFVLGSGVTYAEIVRQTPLMQSWFVDGWFPVFPWLGVAFAGYVAGEARLRYHSFASSKALAAGLCSLAAGVFWWQDQPIERFARSGYPDLFYPPTLPFFLVAAGAILLLFYIVDSTVSQKLYNPLKLYGNSSLTMYVLHTYVIGIYFLPQRVKGIMLSFDQFLLVYIGFMGLLLAVAWCISVLRGVERKRRGSLGEG